MNMFLSRFGQFAFVIPGFVLLTLQGCVPSNVRSSTKAELGPCTEGATVGFDDSWRSICTNEVLTFPEGTAYVGIPQLDPSVGLTVQYGRVAGTGNLVDDGSEPRFAVSYDAGFHEPINHGTIEIYGEGQEIRSIMAYHF